MIILPKDASIVSGDDPFLMADANVLLNCLGERNKASLIGHEIFFSGLRISELLDHPLSGNLDYRQLQRIHAYIFQDIYPDWAGKTRTIRISKSEKVLKGRSVEYANPGKSGSEIENKAHSLLQNLRHERWLSGLPSREFSERMSYYLSHLWKIHPFREGNTRTIMVFFYQLAERAGHRLSLEYLERSHRPVRKQLVLSTVGDTHALSRYLLNAIKTKPR